MALVSLAVIVRPTALIVWLPLLIYHFWKEDDKLKLVTHTFFPIGLVPLIQRPPSFSLTLLLSFLQSFFLLNFGFRASALVVSTLIDCIFYEKVKLSYQTGLR